MARYAGGWPMLATLTGGRDVGGGSSPYPMFVACCCSTCINFAQDFLPSPSASCHAGESCGMADSGT